MMSRVGFDVITPVESVKHTMMAAIDNQISPTLAAELIVLYGPNALWLYISVAHIALILFGLYRMTRRPSPTERASYRWLPRTTMVIGRLFDRGDDTPTR